MRFDLVGWTNRAGFFMKKHGPEILVFGGALGTLVGGVMACVATTHLPEVNEKAKARFEAVRKQHPQEIRKQEMTKAYFPDRIGLYEAVCTVCNRKRAFDYGDSGWQ